MTTTRKKTAIRKSTAKKSTAAKKPVKKASLASKPKPVRKTSLSPTISQEPLTHGAIAERAYLLWQQEGCHHGRDLIHWIEAETQLRREVSCR